VANGNVNGGKFTPASIVLTLFVASTLGVTGWMLSSIIKMREFMSAGGRWTYAEARSQTVAWEKRWLKIESHMASDDQRMEHIESEIQDLPPQWLREQIGELRIELRRQQLQIDRLEGHDVKNYTEDHSWIESESSHPSSSLP